MQVACYFILVYNGGDELEVSAGCIVYLLFFIVLIECCGWWG